MILNHDELSGAFSVGTSRVLLKAALALGEDRNFTGWKLNGSIFLRPGEFWVVARIDFVPRNHADGTNDASSRCTNLSRKFKRYWNEAEGTSDASSLVYSFVRLSTLKL